MTQYERVLVTGGSGRVGRYVVDELVKGGHGVTVFDLNKPQAPVPFVPGTVLDLPAVEKAVKGVDVVVHLAAHDWIMKVRGDEFIHVNVLGSWNVLQASEQAGVRKVVVCSSISATGLEEMRPDFPPEYLPIDEKHVIKPVEPYSVSKQMVEEAALSFARRGRMDVICLRPQGVSVPGSLERYVTLTADPNNRWFNCYVTPEDTASAFRLAVERDIGRFDLFFVSARDTTADVPTLDLARRLFGTLPTIRKPAYYRDFPRASLIDVEHARTVLGFEAKSDWPRLRATIA